MNSFIFLFFGRDFVVYGLPQAFGLRNDEGVKGNDFFLFSIFIFTISGLWIASLRSQ